MTLLCHGVSQFWFPMIGPLFPIFPVGPQAKSRCLAMFSLFRLEARNQFFSQAHKPRESFKGLFLGGLKRLSISKKLRIAL